MRISLKYNVKFHLVDYANDEVYKEIEIEVSKVPQIGEKVDITWQGKPEQIGSNGFEVVDVLHTYELSIEHDQFFEGEHETDFESIDVYLKERK